jgi:hypothetical protein
MKTLNSVILAAIAAAILLVPVSAELAVSVTVIGGLSALLLGDYGREHSAIALPA